MSFIPPPRQAPESRMALPPYPPKKPRMHFRIRLTNIIVIGIRKPRHPQRRMQTLPPLNRPTRRRTRRPPPPQTIPLNSLILPNRLHAPLLMHSRHLLRLPLRSYLTHRPDNPRPSSDGVGAGFGLRLLLLGNGAHLVQVAFKDCGVRNVFGGFGELEQDDAGADDEEAEDDVDDLRGSAVEALEEDGAGDDGAAGEVDVVGWRY